MPKFKETDNVSEKLEETKDVKLPQETVAPQQEIQEQQETAVTTDDIADTLKKTNITDDVSPRRLLKTDYSSVLWGKAADEVNQENRDINQFVQELDQRGLTPEQYRAQKLSEYAALDDPIQKEGQEPQATSVPKDSIVGALKKEVPAKTEVPAPQQDTQAPQETTVAKSEIADALKNGTPAKKEAAPVQQEMQVSQEVTVAKGEIAAALKKEIPVKKDVTSSQKEVQEPRKANDTKEEVATLKQEIQEPHKADRLEVKFETKKEISSYIEDALEKFKDSDKKNYQKFNKYLKENNTTIEDLVQQPFEKGRNYSRYVTNIANLAMQAEIDSKYAGTIAHRIAELHTLNAYPERILDGSRLVEQEIGGGLEVDRVVVRKGIHYIKDFKPIHLSDFEKTEMGGMWIEYMSRRYDVDFREKIKNGKLLPVTKHMDRSIKRALKEFMQDDVKNYKNKLETYRVLYKNERELDDAKVKVSVQPYYVFG